MSKCSHFLMYLETLKAHIMMNVLVLCSPQFQAPASFPSGIFAGTKIAPEVLVQSLKFEEPLDVSTAAKKGEKSQEVTVRPGDEDFIIVT